MGMGNLLNQALGAIPPTSIVWKPYASKTINSLGVEVATYGADVAIDNAIVQPLSNKMRNELQLASEKEYIRVFVSADVALFEKARFADRILWNGNIYTVIKNTRWFVYDGWNEVICVREED